MPKRDAWLRVRLTEQERALLDAYAEQQGLRISEVIRELVRGLRRKVAKG